LKLKQLFMLLFVINAITLFIIVLIIREYQMATIKLEEAYNMQYKSLILADELRQSSDDLTRMARTYVLTGDAIFEEQYRTVLDIRNGKKPRPKRYNGIFWDFYTLQGTQPLFDGETIPLRELMKRANFPDEELGLLFTSQNESDDLTNLENKAMNAIKGIFQDEKGNYTVYKESDYKLARELMHSDEYHLAKIRIMGPLDQFYKAFESRTKQKVLEAHGTVKRLESYVNISVIFSILLFLVSCLIILLRIIYPLERLQITMSRLSQNDMSAKINPHQHNDEVGDMIHAVEIFKDNTQKLIESEDILKHAMENANSANKAKSIFLARMSHELRTPLNAILGFAALLTKSTRINQHEVDNLHIIRKSGEHLLYIINEILELSKIEAGKIEIVTKSFNFYEMIKEIEAIFLLRCQGKGLGFYVSTAQDVPYIIEADEQRLKEILINLLTNALKFTEKGTISLKIYCEHRMLFFEVEDSGFGIKKEDIERVFRPFEQVKHELFKEHGTGLGLSIAKELITLMGGNIDVESTLGQGSKFTFNIAYNIATYIEKPQFLHPCKVVQNASQSSKTILVVDDILENRILVVSILEQYGFIIYEAQNGYEALQCCQEQKIDLIFMDILMDGMDGLETVQRIRTIPSYQLVPIIVLSANVFHEDQVKALEAGATDFLPKPVIENDILMKLNHYLSLEWDYEENNLHDNRTTETIKNEWLNTVVAFAKAMDSDAIEHFLQTTPCPKVFKEMLLKMVQEYRFSDIVHYCVKMSV